MRFPALFLLAALSVAPAMAAEDVVFTSGSRMRFDRHEIIGTKVRLYNPDGYVEMDLSRIHAFEPIPEDPVAVPAMVAPPAPVQPATPTQPVLSPQELADAAADKYGLPRTLVRAVMEAESGYQTGAVSPKGAIGLMQLMPETAQALGVDPNDPVQNVDAGARYLRDLLQKYDGGLWHALAAYNAGPGAVDKYNGVPPYNETLLYVKRIDQQYTKSTNQ
jgi:soluble lytic murein transglycosylase-like protein